MNAVNFLNLEYLFLKVYQLLNNFDIVALLNWILGVIVILRPFALVLTLLLLTFIVYVKLRLRQLSKEEKKLFNREVSEVIPVEKTLNEKWVKVQNHINSPNPNDWRMAIVEADIMLGEVLEKAGYHGDSIGDQLKSIERSDMLTLDSAWEAHKVRNLIAHEGSNYQLNERDARRTIDLYEKVFREFYYI
jgi:hypothetical protein